MKKMYLLLISLSAAFLAKAQPTLPALPVTCNANSCITNSNIDVCPATSNTVVTDTRNGVYNRGNASNNLGAGAIWRYRNIATVGGVTINAEVTINIVSNATLENIDDDGALDQANNSIASFFSPRIGPDQNLNGTNRRGFVQFTMTFFKNSTGVNANSNADFATPVSLSNVNYVHYDIDGNDADNRNTGASGVTATAGSWYRETGLAQRIAPGNPIVLANLQTDLVSYTYTDPVTTTWTGFAGTTCEREGVSRCAQVASSFSYNGSLPSISFRMGYDYNAGGNVGRPVRQYGSRLGCFNFPSQSTLPVRLLSFNASYHTQKTTLNWSSDLETNFEKYIVERSTTGSDFTSVGEKLPLGGTSKNSYELVDDLNTVNGSTFYYRLKMLDKDGKFKYSAVVLVKKEAKALNGISISPNPVRNSINSVRFSSPETAMIDVRVMDITGKVILQQQNKVYEGNNSISINQLDKLMPGIYVLQMQNGSAVSVAKFSVVR